MVREVQLKNKIGIPVVILGVVIFIICLFADQIGLGDKDPDHFTLGTKQIAGMVFGGIVFISGIFICKR